MKLGFLGIIICVISMSANQVLAVNYQSDISQRQQNQRVSASQISAAKLLQDYVLSYKTKVTTLYASYSSDTSLIISNFNFQTSNMYATLEDVQKGKYNEKTTSTILSEIVDELKVINTRMKVFLQQEKTLYLRSIQQKQRQLSQIGSQISSTLDSLLLSISNQLLAKKSLSQRDTQIVAGLIILREQNNKIKQFHALDFASHEEMNSYIRDVIGRIRGEFIRMRQL